MRYFHVTTANFGSSKLLVPRMKGDHRPNSEPKLSRICVSPTIWQCFLALGECLDDGEFSIQVYCADESPTPSYGVEDADITDEHWYTTPTRFHLFRVIEKTPALMRLLGSFNPCYCKDAHIRKVKRYVDLFILPGGPVRMKSFLLQR